MADVDERGASPPSQEAVAARYVFTRLTRDFEALVAAVGAAVATAHRPAADECGALTRRVDRTCKYIVKSLATGEPLAESELDRLRHLSARLGDTGVGPEPLAAIVRHALAVIGEKIAVAVEQEVVDRRVPPDIGVRLLHTLNAHQARLGHDIESAFVGGNSSGLHLPAGGAPSLLDLLLARCRDQDALSELEREADVCLVGMYELVVFMPAAPAIPLDRVGNASVLFRRAYQHSIAGSTRRGPRAPHAVVAGRAGNTSTRLECERLADEIAKELGLLALCCEPAPLGPTIADVYERATADVAALLTLTVAPGALTADQVAFHRVCAAAVVDERLDFVERTCGAMLADLRRDLLIEVVEAYLRTGQPSRELARTLDIHLNTVTERFAQVTLLTGLRVSVPDELMRLALALRLRRVVTDTPLGA